jgi:hypothetical protein
VQEDDGRASMAIALDVDRARSDGDAQQIGVDWNPPLRAGQSAGAPHRSDEQRTAAAAVHAVGAHRAGQVRGRTMHAARRCADGGAPVA